MVVVVVVDVDVELGTVVGLVAINKYVHDYAISLTPLLLPA